MIFARFLPATLVLLGACQATGDTADGSAMAEDARPWTGTAAGETVRFLGTEPFWGGHVTGDQLTWDTPENPDGSVLTVSRFAGRNGLGFSGSLDAQTFDLALSEGACSDGMSDRTYPFIVTVRLGPQTLRGCGWSDSRPFTGEPSP